MGENIIYRNNPREGNPRLYSESEWKYFPISLWVSDSASALPDFSFLGLLIGCQHIPRLFLTRISAFHSGTGTITGDTIINLAEHAGGPSNVLGSLTMLQGLASFTEATVELNVDVTATNGLVILAKGTDGGHRQIFATAWLAQVPLRR